MHNIQGHSFLPLKSEPIVIDLGGHRGEFATGILLLYPLCRLTTYEPTKGILKSDRDNWVVVEKAVSHVTCMTKLWMDDGGHNFNNSLFFKAGKQYTDVEAVAFNDILRGYSYHTIDLVKMDIEGEEIPIILNADPELFQYVKQFSIEFHDFIDRGIRPQIFECIRNMMRMGFAMYAMNKLEYREGTEFVDVLFVNMKYNWS